MTAAKGQAPFLTVVTVNLDNVAGLMATRDSVSRQDDRSQLEWIVIDGGSVDGSVQMLGDSFYPDRLVVGRDEGIYDAMNIGLSLASGSWVIFLNSGDAFASPRVSSDLRRLVDSGRQFSWGYGRTVRSGGQSERGHWDTYSFDPFDIRQFALGQAVVPHQATFIRTSLARELGGYRTTIGIAADQEFLLRAALRSQPLVVRDVVAVQEPGGRGSARPIWAHVRDIRRFRNSIGLVVYGPWRDRLHDEGRVLHNLSRVAAGRLRRQFVGTSPLGRNA